MGGGKDAVGSLQYRPGLRAVQHRDHQHIARPGHRRGGFQDRGHPVELVGGVGAHIIDSQGAIVAGQTEGDTAADLTEADHAGA